MVTIALIVSG